MPDQKDEELKRAEAIRQYQKDGRITVYNWPYLKDYLIEETRKSSRLTGKDYAVRINCRPWD